MIPDFLKKFEKELKKYEREFVEIEAKPLKDNILKDSLDLKESKFLGKPFFPLNKDYPKDSQGNHMIMIAQINFEQVPKMDFFPEDGLLQLYLDKNDWYDDNYKIIYHSKDDLKNSPVTDFSFIKENDYDESPIFKIHKLSFKKSIDRGNSEDSQFDFLFDGESYWDFEESLSDDEQHELFEYFISASHKIGGYGEFTQSDIRENSPDTMEDIQVLQIDVDDEIMFGDSGVAHIFIDKESLIKKDFAKAYFYWDCC